MIKEIMLTLEIKIFQTGIKRKKRIHEKLLL